MRLPHWLKGIRFYLAAAILLVSVEVWWWATTVYGNSSQAVIRTQEIYGWIALILLVLTLAVGPLLKLFRNLPRGAAAMIRDSRRMLGIGAAWFAVWHAGINYIVLFNLPNPFTLADTYQLAFLFGATALLILLILAFTSFDAAFRGMGVWWFRVHRLVYAAALLVPLHVFTVNVSGIPLWGLAGIILAGAALIGLHIYVLARGGASKRQWTAVIIMALLLFYIAAYGVGSYLESRGQEF